MTAKRRQPGKAQTRRPKPRRTPRQRAAKVAKVLAIVAAVGALVLTGIVVVLYQAIDIPDENEAFQAQTTFVYYKGGEQQLGTYYEDQNRESIPLDEMPQTMQDAVVAAENQTFWTDKGIDPKGILRALFSNARGNARQGASTITQQYVKILYLTSEQSYKRKIKEAIVSLKIQQKLSKKEVLEGYLNTIYFGRGAYGIQAASKAYFGHPASELNLRESAVLATVLNNPTKYDPANGKEAKDDLKGRYQYVLDSMAELGSITAEERDTALKRLPKFPKIATQSQFGGQKGHMLALVKQELLTRGIATEEEIDGGGLRITTTFDPQVMADIEEAVLEQRPDAGMPGPAGNKDLHVGAATVDTRTGELLGFYGGQDYLQSQINWAVAGGMAGSTMKAATDVAAIRDGFSLTDTFEGNSPIDIAGTEFENQGDTDYGSAVSMITATENSVNTAFVDMVDSMDDGPQKVIQAAEDMGIPGNGGERWGIPRRSSDLQENVGVTLGTAQVSPINMANAYATLANGGTRNEVHVVQKVVNKDGETIYDARPGKKKTVDSDIAADVTYALQQVVEQGSGTEALALARPVAGKTGTATNDDGGVSSSWFVGTTPQVSTAVMFVRGRGRESLDEVRPDGADLWLPTSSDGRSGYFGGNYPAKTWTSIMERVMEGREVEDFPEPAYVDGDAPEDGHEYTPPPPPPPKPSKPTKTATGGVPTESPTETPTETPTSTPTETPTTPVPTETPTTPVPTETPTTPVPTLPTETPTTPAPRFEPRHRVLDARP
ncbi:transglycosylase domain-containing protein [Microbacterium sp. ARD31]|uniref:transglycosylase domain-containing protein n=1 Tax=Microbacterium sp. ARD31 TaxID=2962576 RepID=UPI0028818F97|nr:transglycosylase domain-containing protein [Microbacterium sp. ARD31]MDT0185937.1 transglycosylase domain-containing protein [Microbacterium sp. ARD31]